MHSDAVVVHGITSPGATVRINDQIVAVEGEGTFKAEVPLLPGVNRIEVVATGALGNRESRAISVTLALLPPQPFFLLITEPENQSIVSEATIRVTGRTAPAVVVSVNGVGVGVDALGIFSTTVALEPGPNVIEVVATNPDGRVLSAVVALIFRP